MLRRLTRQDTPFVLYCALVAIISTFDASVKMLHGIECSMSGRGSCYDNAPVESFFSLLKRERIRRQTYPTREDAKTDVFDYIERFYNRWRRHGYLGYISPVDFEKQVMKT